MGGRACRKAQVGSGRSVRRSKGARFTSSQRRYARRIVLVTRIEGSAAALARVAALSDDLPDDVARHLDRGYGHVVQQKIENMLPLFYPDYLKELSVFETYQTSGKKQIYYAGDYMSHALLGGACRSGEDVAQAVIVDWAG